MDDVLDEMTEELVSTHVDLGDPDACRAVLIDAGYTDKMIARWLEAAIEEARLLVDIDIFDKTWNLKEAA